MELTTQDRVDAITVRLQSAAALLAELAADARDAPNRDDLDAAYQAAQRAEERLSRLEAAVEVVADVIRDLGSQGGFLAEGAFAPLGDALRNLFNTTQE